MKTMYALAMLVSLPACSTLMGSDYSKMTAEQISAAVKDKDAAIICVRAGTPWGTQSTTMVRTDKGVVVNGAITVDPDCKASVTNAPAKP